MFLLAVILLMATAGLCWVGADKALARRDPLAAVGYGALYAVLAAVTLLGVA